jgi:XRE family transcriptional regulator, fatty acid utilization regulator
MTPVRKKLLHSMIRKIRLRTGDWIMSTPLIGPRIKALREEKGLSQDDLARQFGFKDRQTVSAIENGERRVSAEELIRAMQALGAPLDYFTDPFLLAGEGRFNWRQSGVRTDTLLDYERGAGKFIAAFRTLGSEVGPRAPLLRHSLGLTRQSRYEDASAAGERFAAEYRLGNVPAANLAEVMERKLGILVLMVDPIEGISGAACRLPDLDVVLINRREVPGRRHFDLAHELFHMLTWEAMPPEHVEDISQVSRSRVEQLADSFAGALLMPESIIDRFGDWPALRGQELIAALNAAADELQVTSSALRWRLVALRRLDKAVARAIPEDRLRHNGRAERPDEPLLPLFSKTFVQVVARAIDEGRISVRKAAEILGLSIDDLAEVFTVHGVEAPYAL